MSGAADPLRRLWIVGTGRIALAVGEALHGAVAGGEVVFTGRRPGPPPHPIFDDGTRYLPGPRVPGRDATALLLAVPDAALPQVAERLAESTFPAELPVLHLSGALGPEVLAPLAAAGASVGALHPLATIPATPGAGRRLVGANWTTEARGPALAFAERLVRALHGRLLSLAPARRPLYHAAAVLCSNYVVALLAESEEWFVSSGLPREVARDAMTSLAADAVENVRTSGPGAALTGPIARGDVVTVALHQAELSPEQRRLYSRLGRSALRVARAAGLDPQLAAELELRFTEGG